MVGGGGGWSGEKEVGGKLEAGEVDFAGRALVEVLQGSVREQEMEDGGDGTLKQSIRHPSQDQIKENSPSPLTGSKNMAKTPNRHIPRAVKAL